MTADFPAESIGPIVDLWQLPGAATPASHWGPRQLPTGQLQSVLRKAVAASHDERSLLATLLGIAAEVTGADALRYGTYDAAGRVVLRDARLPGGSGEVSGDHAQQLLAGCQRAAEHHAVDVQRFDRPDKRIVVAVPVLLSDTRVETIAAVFLPPTLSQDHIVGALQLVASHIALWHLRRDVSTAEAHRATSALLLQVIARLENCGDLQSAAYLLVNDLPPILGCQKIAIGLCRDAGRASDKASACRLTAISHLSQFDRRSELVRAIEAALDEAVINEGLTVWTGSTCAQPGLPLAHRKLCSAAGVSAVVSSPLRDRQGRLVGAWLLLGDKDRVDQPGMLGRFRTFERPVGASLELIGRGEPNRVSRYLSMLLDRRKAWQIKVGLLVAMLAVALLLLPLPYKIGCDCQLQPITSRCVVAPYDGTLDKSRVEPGDLVGKGHVVAELDGRELRWELAGLEAQRGRAAKSRDTALATHDVATAQQARLEMKRLGLQIDLLTRRLENLAIKSPIDGIVISGDLKRAEGVPLTAGQQLFEIAPLDRMVVEIAIPEREIAHVRPGMPVTLGVDAFPGKVWHGRLQRVFPRVEVRDAASVFIGEVHLAETSQPLRPGMNGWAQIHGRRHLLIWNLLHRPYEAALLTLGW
jgi:hypothetical protein